MSNNLKRFDGRLGFSNLAILFKIYGMEKNSKECRVEYENFLKKNYPNEYDDFIGYKNKLKEKTPDVKSIIFDWMDGKTELSDFSLFDVYND